MPLEIFTPSGKLVATPQPTLDPIVPNVGIEVAYQRQLETIIDQMHRSTTWWILSEYKKNKPEIAMDASPAMSLRSILAKLNRYWRRKSEEMSLPAARRFAERIAAQTDRSFQQKLRDKDLSVKFKMTAAENDVIQATIGANVALITGIPEKHIAALEGLVMRSVQNGRDAAFLAKELQKQYGMTKKRAALIARDQNNKATAALARVRSLELGITQAVWVHTHAKSEARPSHLKAGNEKLIYDIEKGAFLDGQWVQPGELINCKCYARPLVPGLKRKQV